MEEKYSFRGRLSEHFPSQIIVDSTEYCNLACTHCPHPTFKKSEHWAGRFVDSTLVQKLVDEVSQEGKGLTRYIRFTSNGEPLIHKQWAEMLDYAVKHSGTTVTLTTNGTLLKDSNIERLIETGVHIIDISLDAFRDETYAKVRKGGDLSITRPNVLRLLKRVREAGSDQKIVVSFIEQPENIAEVSDFESFWRDAGAEYIVIRRLHSCSGAREELAQIRRDSLKDTTRRPCLYPWERLVLNAKGWLSFCPSDWVHGSDIAPYADTTIQEVWSGKFMSDLRRAHLTGEYETFKFCGGCPDWEATRWPDEGRSYADMVEEFREASEWCPEDSHTSP